MPPREFGPLTADKASYLSDIDGRASASTGARITAAAIILAAARAAVMSEDATILTVVTNPTGNWALENLPAFEELYGAIEQLSLEAGAAGDSVLATGSLETAAPAVDIARERVARAAAVVRQGPLPPDAESARHLAAMLDALDEFRTTGDFNDWVHSWTRAMEHRDAFTVAFAIANGQKPPAE